jgi:hypothetical protein
MFPSEPPGPFTITDTTAYPDDDPAELMEAFDD